MPIVPAILYIHGGGFYVGQHRDRARRLRARIAQELGVVVVSVEYRLAPEHPFPAGLEDCYAALPCGCTTQADALGVDPRPGRGERRSAGGGLAAGLALLARDRGGPAICFQYLGIPELDDRLDTPSMQQFHDTPMWSRPQAEQSWEWYLGDAYGSDDVSPYAAPARATDVAGLPPAYISTMEFDPLRDEGIHYALKLLAAGVSVELHSLPGHVPRVGHRHRLPRSRCVKASSGSPSSGVPSASTGADDCTQPLRQSRVRDVDAVRADGPRGVVVCLAEAVGAEHEEGATVVSAQRARERPLACVDRVDDLSPSRTRTTTLLAASANQIAPSASSVHPSGMTSPSSAHTRRSCSVPSSAMVNAVTRRAIVSPTIRVRPSGVMTLPFGNSNPSAATDDVTAGRHPRERRGARRFADVEVEAEVPHVRGAVGRDHHVVAVAGGDRRQVGMDGDPTVVLHAQDPPRLHRHHEQTAVGQPAETARGLVELELHPTRPSVVDARHRVPEEVGEPEPTVVPARTFAEADAVEEDREAGHGGEPTVIESASCAPPFSTTPTSSRSPRSPTRRREPASSCCRSPRAGSAAPT